MGGSGPLQIVTNEKGGCPFATAAMRAGQLATRAPAGRSTWFALDIFEGGRIWNNL